MMLVDAAFHITFLNPAAYELFSHREAQFARRYPGFRVDDLVGRNLEFFDVDIAHQRRLMDDPSQLPYCTTVRLEGLVVGLSVHALLAEKGQPCGFALEWTDGTATALYDDEVRNLHDAAVSGQLSYRGNVARMSGPYVDMMVRINQILEGVLAPIAEVQEAMHRSASGDFAQPIESHQVGDHAVLKEAYNQMITQLSDSLTRIQGASEQINAGSGQVASTASSLARGATTQAAAIEEIGTTIRSVADQAGATATASREVDRVSQLAGEAAARGDERMQAMLAAMGNIEEASRHISRIIKVIDEIAFQTNLLALNAAVEAARAGVHGRGFAVVAEEVRNLAARSAKAAQPLRKQISKMARMIRPADCWM
jgi:methyl-accepting chemotaxis protein